MKTFPTSCQSDPSYQTDRLADELFVDIVRCLSLPVYLCKHAVRVEPVTVIPADRNPLQKPQFVIPTLAS